MKTIAILLCLLFICPSISILAQSPGFVVTQTGDSLYGNISYKNYFFYIEKANGQVDSIHVNNTLEVKNKKLEGRVYYGSVYQFDNDINPVREKADDKIIDTALVLKTVFATKSMTLYEGVDHYKRLYYFIEKTNDSLPTQMLVSYRIMTITSASVANLDANVRHIQIKTYIGQLKKMMADCEKLESFNWDSMDYRSYSFKSVMKWYEKCK